MAVVIEKLAGVAVEFYTQIIEALSSADEVTR